MALEVAPLIPLWAIALLAALAVLVVAMTLWRRTRGGLLRAGALAALLLALVNPVLYEEQREPLESVIAIVVDRSQSQASEERRAQTDAALAAVEERLARYPAFDLRVVEAVDDGSRQAPSTRLFEALSSAIQDVPTARFGGAILITDGQVHDVPATAETLGFDAPVHALITGDPDEADRRIEMVRAPRFGIVGEEQELTYRISDDGPGSDVGGRRLAEVTIRLNGEVVGTESVPVDSEVPFVFEVPRGGNNIIELSTTVLDGEITDVNNTAVAELEGIRENLRVLLVSGEPHAGERAWRNLLKSDASVDLVHFTILRPPEKQDGTPIDQLSLIAFPTRELFVEKIHEFDLIVLDRYQRRGVLPVLYYDNIAQYVEDGGALLIAAGPEYAGEYSIATTPLAPVLPADPTGEVQNAGFFPRLSEDGVKHPVTRGLGGGATEPPGWGRWFRTIGVGRPEGKTVMNGMGDQPLLILNRAGEGRVAMLLSDHGWLWARGFEGGGPHVDLYRRIAHWLMKEPALEEEALTAQARGRSLTIERQTMSDGADDVTVRLPSGESRTVPLAPAGPGLFRAEMQPGETGLFEIADGELTTLAHVGAINAPEFRATVSTETLLAPIAAETSGTVARLSDGSGAIRLPQLLPVRGDVRGAGGRMPLKMTDETELKGVNRLPLFAGFFGLALLLLALGSTWFREGR